MKKSTSTKRSLLLSIVSLCLCIVMLAGTTFAWFTDSVKSENNIITAGNLDIELYWSTTAEDDDWHKVGEKTNIFKDDTLWEPGHTEVIYLKVVNEGSLALKYWLGVNIVKEIEGVNQAGNPFKLSNYIKFGVVETAEKNYYGTREDALKAVNSDLKLISAGYSKENSKLYPKNNAKNLATQEYATLVVTMPEDVSNEANHNGVNVPQIFLGLNVFATQLTYEEDSYGSDYDIGVPWTGEIDTAWYYKDPDASAFVLTRPTQLAGLAKLVNEGTDNFEGQMITLGADMELSNGWWTPIGTKANAFCGIFDGANYTVRDLNVVGNNDNVGLFGYTQNQDTSEIRNLTIENATVSGKECVSVVVGWPYSTPLTNVTVKGHVEVNGWRYVGGIAGRGANSGVNWTNITVNVDAESYVKATTVTKTNRVGGIIGMIEPNIGNFKNITTNINVYGDTSHIGGVAGLAHYTNVLDTVTVTGNVISTSNEGGIGGIAGVLGNEESGKYICFNGCNFSGNISDANGAVSGCNLYGGLYMEGNTITPIVNSKDPDGNWAAWDTASLANGLAQDGTVKMYSSLASMHTSLTNNPPLEVPAGKTVTLDLNGYTAQGVWGNSYLAALVNNGTLTVKNGTLKNGAPKAGEYSANGCSVILNNGTLTLQDVTVIGSGWTTNQYAVYPGYAIDNRNKLTVEAGTTINGGCGIKTEGTGAVTEINGGTVDIKKWTGDVTVPVHAHAIYAVAGAKVTINGGNFSMGEFVNEYKATSTCSGLLCVDSTASLAITGGTFNADPSNINGANYVAANYWVQKAGDNYVVVNKDTVLVNNADELQTAVDTVTDGQTIIFAADITGDVLVTQREAVDVTIDGSGHKFNGVMTVFGKGKSDTRTETLTIRNINFVAKAGAESCIVSPDRTVYNSYSYSHNVTVDNCTFTDPDGVVDCAAIRHEDGGDINWTLQHLTVDATMHSLGQLKNVETGLKVIDCTVSSKNGLNVNNGFCLEMTDCNFNVKGYAVRFGSDTGVFDRNFSISNSTLKTVNDDGSDAVIVFRAGAVVSTLTLTNVTMIGEPAFKGNTADTTIIIDGKTQVSSAEKLLDSLKDGGGNVSLNGTVDLGGGSNSQVILTKDTTITGGTIKGVGYDGEMNIGVKATSGNIVFDGVTFDLSSADIKSGSWGMSVNISGTANVTFRNCTFVGNQCPIYQSGADSVVTLENCKFETSSVAIQCEIYSGDFQLGQDLIVKGCDFTGVVDVLHIYDYDKDPSSDAIAQYLTANGNIFTGTCKQTCK